MEFAFPAQKRARLIVNTDAKNEADDQYAIVHALLTPSFEMHGVIAAHFGDRRTTTSMEDSYAEVQKLLDLMRWQGRVRVERGAPGPCRMSRRLRVYETIDARFIHEDFFAKLAQWARKTARA